MEKLEQMKECLIGIVEGQVYGNMDKVDAKELGEAIDMIKDLSEAIYYCTITKAMEEGEEDKRESRHGTMYYAPKYIPMEPYDPYSTEKIMYADGGNRGGHTTGGMGNQGSRYYHEGMVRYPESVDHVYRDGAMRDPHEGKSGERRKMYMQHKGTNDKSLQMKELEAYMQELSQDITEMIQDASPEEKQMLQGKISMLATKIK